MEIKKVQNGNKMTFSLDGRLDVESSPIAQQEIAALPEEITELVLDCSKMEYISSAGLRMLVFAHKQMNPKEGLVITGINENVRDVLRMTGFLKKLHVE